jgi:hypothetical protein
MSKEEYTEGEKALLRQFPSRGTNARKCNLGDCPAFHMTEDDSQQLAESDAFARQWGLKAAVAVFGVPQGTCRVNQARRDAGQYCVVSDRDFLDYFHKQRK